MKRLPIFNYKVRKNAAVSASVTPHRATRSHSSVLHHGCVRYCMPSFILAVGSSPKEGCGIFPLPQRVEPSARNLRHRCMISPCSCFTNVLISPNPHCPRLMPKCKPFYTVYMYVCSMEGNARVCAVVSFCQHYTYDLASPLLLLLSTVSLSV